MKLFCCVLFAVGALCAAQGPVFRYDQQFGQGVAAGPGPLLAAFDNQRTFRLKQVPVQVQETVFPGQPAPIVPTPAIIAPIPVVRSIINAAVPIVPREPVAIPSVPINPVVRAININPEPIAQSEPAAILTPTVPQKTRRLVKRVRAPQENAAPAIVPHATAVEVDRGVNSFPEPIETPRALSHNRVVERDEDRRLREEEEAKGAHYSFSSSVQDSINDHAIQRSETRDGLALKGMYSYSDGFFKRTVHYQADQDGYRVVK